MNHEKFAAEALLSLSELSGVSGYEKQSLAVLKSLFADLATEIIEDHMGNTIFIKKGKDNKKSKQMSEPIGEAGKIMLAAHFDEIGLMVTQIDGKGILRFVPVGGIDNKTLLNQAVIVHGKTDLHGVVCYEPKAFLAEKERDTAVNSGKMGIDLGLPAEKVREAVKPGDIVSISSKNLRLLNDLVSGKAFDNRAGITVMAICLRELGRLKHKHDVYAVASVQEEVGLRGAATSSYHIDPDAAFVIDVTHAQTTDSKNQVNISLGKGPAAALGPNIHSGLLSYLRECAKENRIPLQLNPTPGPTGTDARVIQLTKSGIPTALLAIPLRYMHSSIETVSLQDIVSCGVLLAHLIANLPENLEDSLCS